MEGQAGVSELIDSMLLRVSELAPLSPPADTNPPVIHITSPSDGATVESTVVSVAGYVDEDVALASLSAASPAETRDVTPPGYPPRYYFGFSINCRLGENTIQLTAEDSAGNVGTAEVTINCTQAGTPPSATGEAQELLIIIPYKASGGTPAQQDPDWVEVANTLAEYKTRTGLATIVMTLDSINRHYAGRDEPERIKRAIYRSAILRGVKYVMLVGNADLFPVRYRLAGYTAYGATFYRPDATYCADYCVVHRDYCDDDGHATWCPYTLYTLRPCDAYYANLWHDGDPHRAFDDWDQDGDNFFGEMYADNLRGVDGNTIHPDVAVARVTARTPEEFNTFVQKVMAYEREAAYLPAPRQALFVAGNFDESKPSKEELGRNLGSSYDIRYIERHGDDEMLYDVRGAGLDGRTAVVFAPDAVISQFINVHEPLFVNYAGHGFERGWSEVYFGLTDVPDLVNEFPFIAGAVACETAPFAESARYQHPPSTPVLSTRAVYSFAQALVTGSSSGAVVYMGTISPVQPYAHYLDRAFFESMADGAETVGDAWLTALDAYIDYYDLPTIATPWIADHSHPDGGYYSLLPAKKLSHVYNMELFGDPSLRIAGLGRSPFLEDYAPATAVHYDRPAHVDPADQYIHIAFQAADKESGVLATHYRYHVNNVWTPWLTGSEFYMPIPPTANQKAHTAEVEYYSVDKAGNREKTKKTMIEYDFSPLAPQALVTPVGSAVSGKVIDEKGRPLPAVLSLGNKSVHWEAQTDAEGQYMFSNIPAGTYLLQVAQAPAGYRQFVPEKSPCQVVVKNNHTERGFVFVRDDGVRPTMTQELPWEVAVASGCIYGLAYDDWYGTGVKQVQIAVTDANKRRWLSTEGTWSEQETWFTPQYLMPLEEFLAGHLSDRLLSSLSPEVRKAQLTKLAALPRSPITDRQPLVWVHCFSDPVVLATGWKVVRGRVTDGKGNVSFMESTNVEMTADFAAEPAATPLTVQFTDQSQGFVAEYAWDFGDGGVSVFSNPTHTYKTPGTYKVTLMTTGPYASDAVTKKVEVGTAANENPLEATPTNGPLHVLGSASATQVCSSGYTHALKVTWNVSGGKSPIGLTIQIKYPDGSTKSIAVSQLKGERTFKLNFPQGGTVTVTIKAQAAGYSSSSSYSTSLSPCQ